MPQRTLLVLVSASVLLLWVSAGLFSPALGSANDTFKCSQGTVEAGSWCVDKYEVSVWVTDDAGLIRRIKAGRIKSADELAGKATLLGQDVDDYDAAGCPDTGNGCTRVYAVSVPGVIPSGWVTWFQAAAACRNSGKELLPNRVWQVAALGTPDPGPSGDGVNTCNTSTGVLGPTGTTGNCVSDVGAFDMVGNIAEWVADWVPASSGCVTPLFGSGDFNCFAGGGIPSPGSPAAPLRGGGFANGTAAGVFTINALIGVQFPLPDLGFRCGRPAIR